MFCPNCKAEYREGFFECSDCRVPLVETLPPEVEENLHEESLVTILASTDMAQFNVAESILSSASILFFVRNEGIPALRTELQVYLSDAEEAKSLLEDLDEDSGADSG